MYSRRINPFGHQTSLRLEPELWALLAEIRRQTGISLRTFIEIIAMTKPPSRSLASAMRVAIAAWFHPDPHQHKQWRHLGRIVPGRDGATVSFRVSAAIRPATVTTTRLALRSTLIG
jgi:predicted DNA-binding ribbon-helix-helix protein